MSAIVTLVTDRADFAKRWTDALSQHGMQTQSYTPDDIARAAHEGNAVVIDVSLRKFQNDEDELLAYVGFVRASGAMPIAHLPPATRDVDDIIEELCYGLVARSSTDIARIAASLSRRLRTERDSRFEFVTISPCGNDVLAIFANGDAVLERRPLGPKDDGSPIAVIRLAENAQTATLELESGAHCELHAEALRPEAHAHTNGDGMLALEGGELGARLKALRLAAGLTQAELARRTGIHRPNIARVEAGRHTPSLETLSRIAHAIGVPTTQVLVSR